MVPRDAITLLDSLFFFSPFFIVSFKVLFPSSGRKKLHLRLGVSFLFDKGKSVVFRKSAVESSPVQLNSYVDLKSQGATAKIAQPTVNMNKTFEFKELEQAKIGSKIEFSPHICCTAAPEHLYKWRL